MRATNLYSLRLQPHAATLSPWQADTLFGHLCWQVFFERGKPGLAEFLEPFARGAPPFVLSDGFPCETFPRPIVPRAFESGSKQETEQRMDDAKNEKKVVLLSRDQFERALRGEEFTPSPPDFARSNERVLKNQINRLTGTTTGAEDEDEETGRLYAVQELAFYQREENARVPVPIDIYVWAHDAEAASEVEKLFRALAQSGYGKKKSAGYGKFGVERMTPLTLTTPDDANGFVALANFVPAPSDPTDGHYGTVVKYGKLGEAAILDGKALSPFKRPLLMFTAGSTFFADPIPPFVGRLVQGIHWEDPTIVQGAFAPVVPIRLPRGLLRGLPGRPTATNEGA